MYAHNHTTVRDAARVSFLKHLARAGVNMTPEVVVTELERALRDRLFQFLPLTEKKNSPEMKSNFKKKKL